MKTIDELLAEGVTGKRVFVRADLNVPLDGTTITDDGRIRAVLPTVKALAEAGARVVVASHLGRPKGAPDPAFSLLPAAERLGELLGAPVAFAQDTVGPAAHDAVDGLQPGQVAVIENLRFNAGETSRTTPSAVSSRTASPPSRTSTSATDSARCTASTPPCTTCRPVCRTTPATSSPPRSAS